MMSETKNLTVVQLLPELDGGGVERGTLELGRHLVEKGHHSIVVSGGGRLQSQLESEGSEHIQMETGRKSPASLRYFFPLRNLMLERKVDILHMRSRMPAWIGYLSWKSLPVEKRPVLITTFHGFYSVNGYSAVMTKGEAVIAVSESVKKHIADNYKRIDDVRVIHRGVDSSFLSGDLDEERLQSLKTQWSFSPESPVIMLPARFTRWKGHHLFLDALKAIGDMKYCAILVGDYTDNLPYTKELDRKILEYGLQDRVHMVGHCQDMAAANALSDIVVSASSGQAEAFGRVAIEAMALGKPVIATAHGGSLETVVDAVTGWLVKPGDVEEMSNALKSALSLSKTQREEIGLAGRERVLSHFTSEKMCEKTVSLYYEMLERKTMKE